MKLEHDGKITIATGHSRTAKTWKNKEMFWSEFLTKLSETTRTRETLAEYHAMSKTDQDNVKDVGGFVGGYVAQGRRVAGNAKKRYLITLDADFGDDTLLSTLDIIYGGFAYAVYSTHKHTADAPRLRIVLPLKTPVSADAYQAVSRRIASDIGMDLFDDTTYEPERLMYWPSTSADGDYVFTSNDAEWLDPEVVLSRYDDWHDATTWPESSRTAGIRRREAKKQGDPLTKSGVIGAFCRAYSIEESIDTFLGDVYDTCSKEGRYTYKEGSTTAGLVVYEDKFAYSHHGTDPISGKLVNAFDLVRIHLFGVKDEDNTLAVNKQPSFKAMQDMAVQDERVKSELDKAMLESAKEDFGEVLEDDLAWMGKLERQPKTGIIESNAKNVKIVLENDCNLAGRVAYNDFSFRTVLFSDMPWRGKVQGEMWDDRDDSCLRNYLSNVYNIKGTQVIADVCAEVFSRNHFHPVKDYLKGLKWDGVKRLDTLWVDYLGAEDSEYVRTVTRKHLVAAVSRVMRPGCKFDNVIILCGPQGIGKSTMLKKLGKRWFSDSITTVQGKEAFEQLHGAWIIEMGELYATRKAENEAVKQFLSKSEDIFRQAYGRRNKAFPRQCVFYGTTNDSLFLRDRTGNRRFWPVEVGQEVMVKDFADFESEVDQVWAEAYELYLSGETLYLDSRMEKEARKQQDAHSEESEKTGLILDYLERKLPGNWAEMNLYERREWLETDEVGTVERYKVCVMEIWCEVFNGDPKNLTGMTSREINNILRQLPEWEDEKRLKFGKLYGQQRAFVRRTKCG